MIWGCPRYARVTSARTGSMSRRRSIRCTFVSVRRACSFSSPHMCRARRSSRTTRTSHRYSDSWVAHAKRYAQAMIARLSLTDHSLVTEVASNDGYLLQHFLAEGIPVLGIEPAANVAEAARSRGIRTEVKFLGPDTGRQIVGVHGQADLVAANNVFAHVPDIRGFAAGLRALVKDTGLVTLEFPHLLRLIERRQYDTIYHEHFSYLSLLTSSRALSYSWASRSRRRRTRHSRRLAACVRAAGGKRRRADRPGQGGARRRGGGRPAHRWPGIRASPARY